MAASKEFGKVKFQEGQLKALGEINKSLTSTFKISENIHKNMESTGKILNTISASSQFHAKTLFSIAVAVDNSAKNLHAITKDLVSNSHEYVSLIDDLNKSYYEYEETLSNINKATEDYTDTVEQASGKIKEGSEDLKKGFKEAVDGFANYAKSVGEKVLGKLGGWSGIAESINKFSEISNDAIKYSGSSGAVVREFKSDLMGIISGLNSETGYLYNPSESYKKMVDISSKVTSNLDAIEEMARPLLLADETLSINMESVAEIFNKFYSRYNFNSLQMEETLDSIRQNTAGNAASEQAIAENMAVLENWVNYTAGDNNELRQDLLDKVGEYTSWLESMNVNSGVFTGMLKDIAGGNYSANPNLVNILSHAGVSATDATNMARSGRYTDITKALMEGINSIFSSVDGSFSMDQMFSNYGIDADLAMNISNLMKSGGFKELEVFIEEQSKKNTDMASLANDKFVSMEDKLLNRLEEIYSSLASIQEMLPFGFSDVVTALSILGGAKLFGGGSGSKILQAAGKNITGGKVTSAAGTTALGALNVAGAAGGLAMAGYAGYNAYKDFNEGDKVGGWTNTGAAAAGLGGSAAIIAGMAGAGAAAGPIGWALLAVGGLALVANDAREALAKVGTADAVEKAYEEAADAIRSKALDHKESLSEIQVAIDQGKDLEEIRKSLIDSGILSESDVQKAREANIDGLEALTQAYLKSTDQMSTEALAINDKYKRLDKEYAHDVQSQMEKTLQDWLDSGDLKNDKEKLGAVEALFHSLYTSLGEQDTSSFDEDTKKTYENLAAAFDDGKLSSREANKILDAGKWNTVFQNSNLGVESLVKALEIASVQGSAGKELYNLSTEGLGPYYGIQNTSYAEDISKVRSGYYNKTLTKDEAKKILDDLKNQGFSTAGGYSEMQQAASLWGLTGYSEGTNFIAQDQIAVLHHGEAVVPRKYNPAVNSAEIKEVAEQLAAEREQAREEAEELKGYYSMMTNELKEIKEFLAFWKSSKEEQDRYTEFKRRHGQSTEMAASYMA